MRTIKINICKYEELSDKAKETARDWFRSFGHHDDWYESTYEDAITVGKLMGIEIEDIRFSGFSSQGDGASFTGKLVKADDILKNVKEYAPLDTTLHEIAGGIEDIQQKYDGKVAATLSRRDYRYFHEYTVTIEVDDIEGVEALEWSLLNDEVCRLLRKFMKWTYRQLEDTYDGLNSDESVYENIIANEYEFYETGEKF
jgi:hypothetical protein